MSAQSALFSTIAESTGIPSSEPSLHCTNGRSCVVWVPVQIILHLFYSLVWGGERLTSDLRGLPENLPIISKSADLSWKVPNTI